MRLVASGRDGRLRSVVAAVAAALIVLGGAGPVRAQADDHGLDIVQIRDNFYVIAGAGANILAQIGPAGVILVDSGAEGTSDRVLAALRTITPLPIRYIFNTTMDADHVGGNDALAQAGLSILPGAVVAGAGLGDELLTNEGGASVLAHENVLTRMTLSSRGPDPVPASLWPTKTFAYRQYAMYLNGEGIQIIHVPEATTDGDVIVFFRRGDVIAAGDVIDTTRFPVIHTDRGGTVQGTIDALNRLMDLSILNVPAQWIPDRTFVVPGHGRVYDKLDLLEYRDAITIVRDRIQALVDEGKTLGEVQAANPTLGYRSEYGADEGPWTTEMFVEVIYRELAGAAREEAQP